MDNLPENQSPQEPTLNKEESKPVEAPEQPKKKSKKALIISLVVVFLVAVAGAAWYFFFSPAANNGQEKVYRVGLLSGHNGFASSMDGFKDKMTKLGYIEGENIIYDLHKYHRDSEAEEKAAKQFIEDKVDLIVVQPTEPAQIVQEETKGTNIPVIFIHAGTEGSNLVKDLRNPGGNLSGVRFIGPDLSLKRTEILVAIKPEIKTLYVVYQKGYPNAEPALEVMRPYAKDRGIKLIEFGATEPSEVAIDLAKRSGIDAIQTLPDQVGGAEETMKALQEYSNSNKIPYISSPGNSLNLGAIFVYNSDPYEEGELAADIAAKVFNGVDIGEIPVVTPNGHLKINYKQIEFLDLSVPEGILSIAEELEK